MIYSLVGKNRRKSDESTAWTTDNLFLVTKGFSISPLSEGKRKKKRKKEKFAYRASLSGFFNIMGGDDDRPAVVGAQTDQMVPDAGGEKEINEKKKKENKFKIYLYIYKKKG